MRSGGGGVEYESAGLGMSTSYAATCASLTSIPIHSSNLGFKLLKKYGWREGTGLGIAEQGRLEPVPVYIKKNKRGLGAEKSKKAAEHLKSSGLFLGRKIVKDGEKEKASHVQKTKGISKKMKKVFEFENRMQEKEFERAIFREFWPDNV
ncbi:G-patch domain-containing protein C1486.03-like [Nicotiana tabacum]|uniref:G-patch domain-containing protein C1486.03-like n=1 Tax=Nicotiana tabacum TaxID=4097 RepID=A0A1S3ZPK4_TOBAC|nr:PREDICTED: G-patch domain-containing protein C1486.03-like [Nicotiana tabacum]